MSLENEQPNQDGKDLMIRFYWYSHINRAWKPVSARTGRLVRDLSLPCAFLWESDIKMTMRYAPLSKEFAREKIQLMNGLTSGQKEKAAGIPNAFVVNPTYYKTVIPLIP